MSHNRICPRCGTARRQRPMTAMLFIGLSALFCLYVYLDIAHII